MMRWASEVIAVVDGSGGGGDAIMSGGGGECSNGDGGGENNSVGGDACGVCAGGCE